MFPWLTQHPPISTYGTMIVLGLIAAWLLARARARRAHVDPSHIDLLLPTVLAAGLAGAYLFGTFTDSLTHEAAHGTVLLGSLLLGTTAGIAYALLAHIPLGILGDITAPSLALGIAFGRIGCFFAGCCFGQPSTNPLLLPIAFPAHSLPWQAQLTAHLIPPTASASLPILPTQLYEAALCLLLTIVLTRLRPKVPGEQFLTFALAYAALRFPLELLRADNPHLTHLPLTFSQSLCLLTTLLALLTWTLRRECFRPACEREQHRPGCSG